MQLAPHEEWILQDLRARPPLDKILLKLLWRGKTRDTLPTIIPQARRIDEDEDGLSRISASPFPTTLPLYERDLAVSRFSIAKAIWEAVKVLERKGGVWSEETESVRGIDVMSRTYADEHGHGVRIASEFFTGQEDQVPFRCTTDLGRILPEDSVSGLRFKYAEPGPVSEGTRFDPSKGRWAYLKDGLSFWEGLSRVKVPR